MKTGKPEWQRMDSLFIRLKVHHFNEATARFRPKPPSKRPMTWGQAYSKGVKKFNFASKSSKPDTH